MNTFQSIEVESSDGAEKSGDDEEGAKIEVLKEVRMRLKKRKTF